MAGEIFYWVFNMSLVAALCGLPILLLRRIRRIPRRVFLFFWLIPFLRMCIPVGLGGKYGLMTLLSRFTTKTVTVYELLPDNPFTMTNVAMGANSYFPITYKVKLLETLFSTAAVIWIVIAAAILLVFTVAYLVSARETKTAVMLEKGVYVSESIKSPALYGILKPRILLPCDYRQEALTYILMHERAHIKRGDNLLRLLAFLAVCLHWFNPLCWLFLKLLYEDMELACDETVLSGCDEAQRKAYAHTLVSAVEKNSLLASPFGGAKLRPRIQNILSYKKLTLASAVCFAVLILAAAYILLTNAI